MGRNIKIPNIKSSPPKNTYHLPFIDWQWITLLLQTRNILFCKNIEFAQFTLLLFAVLSDLHIS
ncbi:uncharacterized protein METZ01_LOCUS481535 [marine metagenome]|uniref:Uncharacterized protein n=1 Tax=marine metagenome TaxID=408172 RepID=A0A383C937_9ZZZZ